MKKLGVIGGMGPEATVHFLQKLIDFTPAKTDQEHIEVLCHSYPTIADRTAYILDKSKENPTNKLIEIGKELAGLGAEQIVLTCVTSYAFYDELSSKIEVPIIHVAKELVKDLKENKIDSIAILATEGTIKSGFLQQELLAEGIEPILPNETEQSYVMEWIYKYLKAKKQPNYDDIQNVCDSLSRTGAKALALACTELSMLDTSKLGLKSVDLLDVLAKAAVRECKG